jgi:hypothetical protein
MLLTIDDYFSPVLICIGDAACFLWGSYELNLCTVLGHWPLNTEIWVGSWVNPSEICGRQSSSGTGFSPGTCLLSVTFHLCSIVAFIFEAFLVRRTSGWWSHGKLQWCFSHLGASDQKVLVCCGASMVNIINLCSHSTIKFLTVMFSSQILLSIYEISNSSLIISFIILCVFVLSSATDYFKLHAAWPTCLRV